MCGITAYIGKKNAALIVFNGLKILQNRGYDSAGISTITPDGNLITTKSASQESTHDSIDVLFNELYQHKNNSIGISHTRWASHGSKVTLNSHPHNDTSGRFSLVHNGVIENHNEIRKFLLSHDISCISATDTEVIVQLIGYYASIGSNFEQSVQQAISKLEGTWGLVILDRHDPNCLITARHGSPLLIGIAEDEIFIGSETSVFQEYTTRYISLNNNEIAVVKLNNGIVDLNIYTNNDLKSSNNDIKLNTIDTLETILSSPEPYPYWTIKEISEQPRTILSALNNGGRILNESEVILGGLERNKDKLLTIENLIILGCGTSKNSGYYIADIMREISGFNTIQVIDASEFDIGYIKNTKKVGILAISQSGETKDLMRCLDIVCNLDDVVSFSVVNRVESQIARTTKCGVYLNAGREVGVASTKAFTSQVTVLCLIAIWFSQNRKLSKKSRISLIENLMRLSSCYKSVINNINISNNIDGIVEYLNTQKSCFVLGKGLSSYIAYEGSLKIKEIGYLHAEGYQGGSLKHGPFALIEKGTPIIIILLDDKDKNYMESTISEVKSRDAYTIIITDINKYVNSDCDVIVEIPSNGLLSSLISVIPLQLISYKLSLIRNINPDKPRNLAKTVTII